MKKRLPITDAAEASRWARRLSARIGRVLESHPHADPDNVRHTRSQALQEVRAAYVPLSNFNPPMRAGTGAEVFDIVIRMEGLGTFADEIKHCVDISTMSATRCRAGIGPTRGAAFLTMTVSTRSIVTSRAVYTISLGYHSWTPISRPGVVDFHQQLDLPGGSDYRVPQLGNPTH